MMAYPFSLKMLTRNAAATYRGLISCGACYLIFNCHVLNAEVVLSK